MRFVNLLKCYGDSGIHVNGCLVMSSRLLVWYMNRNIWLSRYNMRYIYTFIDTPCTLYNEFEDGTDARRSQVRLIAEGFVFQAIAFQ